MLRLSASIDCGTDSSPDEFGLLEPALSLLTILDSFLIFLGRFLQDKYRTPIKAEPKMTIPMLESIVIITSCRSPDSKYFFSFNAAEFGDEVGLEDPGVIPSVVLSTTFGALVNHAANNK